MKIGLMLPLGEDDALGRPVSVPGLVEMAVAAEDAGLDSVWAADHVLFRDGEGAVHGIHECWTVLAAVAAATRRVEIGPLVLAVPFRNPALTAKMTATIDELSGGRFILGLGCGWHEPEFDAFDYPFDHRVGRFEEAVEIILPMLRQGSATFDGRWHHALEARLLPPGPRPQGPPVLIAGKGPRMLSLVAKHADAWNAAWFGPPETADVLRSRTDEAREACRAAGRDPSTLALTAGVLVGFPGLPTEGLESVPEDTMRGDAQRVGEMLAGYQPMGMDHLIAHVWPPTAAAVRELGRAAEVARSITAVTT